MDRTAREAAEMLGIKPGSVYKAAKIGTLKGVKRGGIWFFSIEAIEDYLENHLFQPGRKKSRENS
jgi:excisionase family DNA binding protein